MMSEFAKFLTVYCSIWGGLTIISAILHGANRLEDWFLMEYGHLSPAKAAALGVRFALKWGVWWFFFAVWWILKVSAIAVWPRRISRRSK